MKVFKESVNMRQIDFIDPFEQGYMNGIISELKTLKKKVHKSFKDEKKLNKLLSREFYNNEEFHYNTEEELINEVIREKLDNLFHYYYWSDCNYEVVIKFIDGKYHVCGWPNEEDHREMTEEELIELNEILQKYDSFIKCENGYKKIDWWDQVEFRWEEVVNNVMKII